MSSSYILSDNGLSSGSAGLKSSAGNDGVLVLQTANSSGTATNAVYVDNKQNAGFGVTPSNWETGGKVIQMDLSNVGGTSGNSFNIWARSDSARMWVGAYFDGAAYYRQATGVVPTNLSIDSTGGFAMQSAPSGTSGTTFTNPNITAFFSLKKDYTLALQGGNTSATGTGITFPATQSASTDANTLDDYEEGTWTTTTASTVNISGLTLQQARYTKVGRLVTIDGYFESTIASANTLTYFSFTIPFPLISTTAGGCGTAITNNEFALGGVYRASGSTAVVYMLFKASIGFGSGSNLLFFTYTYQTT